MFIAATAWISWHVARLFAWSKLWSASCHSEHGKKRLNDCCATLIYWETFNFSRCQTSMKSAKSANPSRWNHSMFTFPIFSSYPTTAFPCLESYSWGPDMVSSQMLETSGTASEFLAQLGMSNSKQKSDHPRTPVTRIHHFNTGVVFWFEFYISDLKSLLIDYLLILMDHVEYPSFAMFVRCGFKLSVLRRMAWQKWNSSSRRCPKAKQRPFSCGHGTRGWPMGRLDEGMKACTFNVIWICNV